MKTILKNVRISYPDLFKPGKKFGKYSAQFRFSEDSGIKNQIEDAIDAAGTEAFAGDWAKTKKILTNKGKLFRVNDGADKDYAEDYYVTIHTGSGGTIRPRVHNRDASPLSKEDNVIYSGCRVDAWIDISAYVHDEFGPIVSVKLLVVQFRADDEPYAGDAGIKDDDIKPITDGADAPDL